MAINFGPSAPAFTNFAPILAQRDIGGADLLFRGLESLGRTGLQLKKGEDEKQKFLTSPEGVLSQEGRDLRRQSLIGSGTPESEVDEIINNEVRSIIQSPSIQQFFQQTQADLLKAQAVGVAGREERAGALAPVGLRAATAGATAAETGAALGAERVTPAAVETRRLQQEADQLVLQAQVSPEGQARSKRIRELEEKQLTAGVGITEAQRGAAEFSLENQEELFNLQIEARVIEIGLTQAQVQNLRDQLKLSRERLDADLFRLGIQDQSRRSALIVEARRVGMSVLTSRLGQIERQFQALQAQAAIHTKDSAQFKSISGQLAALEEEREELVKKFNTSLEALVNVMGSIEAGTQLGSSGPNVGETVVPR